MTFFLELKEKLKSFYESYSAYLNPVLKFGLALAVFININMMLGFLPQLNSVFVVLILALLCAILPVTAVTFFGCFLIVGHCYAIGIEVAAFALVLILLLMILYLRFSRRDALALVLTPLAFQLHIPCAMPVAYGLTGNVGSGVAVSCGTVLYYFMHLVSDKAVQLQDGEIKEIGQRLQTILDGLVRNQEMWMTIIAFVAVALAVFCIRRASVDYAWTIAIFTGGVLYLLLMIVGGFFMDMTSSIVWLLVGTVVSVMLMLVLKFFVFHVDYSRAEYLQYEDDEYYYYVKAVPKIRISKPERSVKTIEVDSEMTDDLEEQLTKSLKDIHIQ
ncbi:MAG: hypothetical protein PHY23_03320 [Oscillospiraceae bacterium]|nr:hypothetical protein [Oscillospiraceae bacterium]